MATDLLVKQYRAELRKRYFMLLANDVPEGFDRVQVEKDLRELAASLVLQDITIKGEKIKDRWDKISKIENHDQQLIEIIEMVLSVADEAKDEAPAARMDELTAELKEHRKLEAQMAEAKKAEHPNPHQQAEKIIADQARAIANLKKSSPIAAEGIQDVEEVLSTGLVNRPDAAILTATNLVLALASQDSPPYLPPDAALDISPLVSPARIYSQNIDTLVTAVAITLPADLPDLTKLEIAQSFVAFKLAKPNAMPKEYQSLIEKIELRVAAEQQIAVTIPVETPEVVAAAKIDITASELVKQTIQAKLQQAGISEADSQHAAQIITNFAPAIHYVSGFAPKSGQGYEKNKKEVTQKLTNHVVDRLLSSPGSPRAILQALRNTTSQFDFYRLYNTAYGPAQFYQYQPQVYQYPSHPEVASQDPYLTYLYSYAKSYVQDAVVGASLDLAVAGPLGAWILPDAALASAFVFDAGISAAPVAVAAGAVPAAAAATVGTEVVTAGAAAAGAAGGGAATGGFLGALLGPFGIAIGAAMGAITGWIIKNKDKVWNFFKNLGVPILIGAAAFVGLLIAGTAALFAGLGAAVVTVASYFLVPQVASIASVGPSAVLQPIGGFASHVFASLTELAVVEIATPIIVIVMSIPVVVALLLFIINSGAYVVPPSINPLQNPGQSQFITVTKEADISSISNAQLPKTVTYRITVSAPMGSLSNITFNNECSVIKDGSSPVCAHPVPSAIPPNIDSTTPFSFVYAQTYNSSFTDSIVSDSFTVTADSPDGRATSVASASVTIGTPPTQCFDIVGSNWPANYKANVLSAIGTLTSSYTAYSAKLCRTGTLRVIYDITKNPAGWGYYGGGTIYLNGGGLSSQINALYIVAHESGHHFQSVSMPALYRQYLDTPGIAAEIPLCSYVNTYLHSEAFAESIALFVTHDQASSWVSRCSGTFQSKYPKHWDFANSVIFR